MKNKIKDYLAFRFALEDVCITSTIEGYDVVEIENLPNGSVELDPDFERYNIGGMYRVVEDYDFTETGCNIYIARMAVKINNKDVLRRERVRLLASKLGIDYSDIKSEMKEYEEESIRGNKESKKEFDKDLEKMLRKDNIYRW